jgi:glycosyltransferase involved in cell wall biosynthesis
LSDLDIELDNPYKANEGLMLNNKHQNVYVHNIQHPDTEKIVFDFLKSQERGSAITEMITLDILPGMWGLKIKTQLPTIQNWTHLCTLHYSKNVKVLIDECVIKDTKSYESFFINEIEIAKHASTYVTVSQSECAWIKTIVPEVTPMIYYPTRLWWPTSLFTCANANVNTNESPSNITYIRKQHPDKLLILYIGRITHQKGIQQLLQTNIPANVHFVMMSSTAFGDEGLVQTIQTVAKERPNMLTWIGPHYGADKIKIIQQCDAVICPSVFEPFGLVGLETLLFTDTLLIASGVDGMNDYTVEGGFIKCGTTSASIEQTIASFVCMDVATRRCISQKGKIHATQCVDKWSQSSQRQMNVLAKPLGAALQSIPLPPIQTIENVVDIARRQ